MKTTRDVYRKLTYFSPQIERIKLDNEISLILGSESDTPDTEPIGAVEQFRNDPFKANLG